MKYFLLLAPLLTTASFASGYGAKWWNDDANARASFEIRFDDAVQQVAKQFTPRVVSSNQGTYQVRAVCVAEPCGTIDTIAASDLPEQEMIAVSKEQWDALMYIAHVLQAINPDLYDKAYSTGRTYTIGHAEGSIDW